MNIITAEQARAHAERANGAQGRRVAMFLHNICKRIEEAARKGQSVLLYPFDNLPDIGGGPVTTGEQEGVRREVLKLGFKWDHSPHQDAGHPGDRPLDQIRW